MGLLQALCRSKQDGKLPPLNQSSDPRTQKPLDDLQAYLLNIGRKSQTTPPNASIHGVVWGARSTTSCRTVNAVMSGQSQAFSKSTLDPSCRGR